MVFYISEVRVGRESFDSTQAAFASLKTNLRDAPDGIAGKLANELILTLHRIVTAVIGRHGNPWTGIDPDAETLFRRSGGSLRSLAAGLAGGSGKLGEVWASIRIPATLYVHEEAAVIRARGDFMTVPLPAALASNGLPLKASARDWDNTFVALSRAGNLIIFRRDAREIVPLYVLKQSVRRPARLGMTALAEAHLGPLEQRAMDLIGEAFS